jgi:hypothetical protein
MRRLLFSTCAALALAALSTIAPAQVQVGDPAPEFTGDFLHTDAHALADLRGRVVLVDFWRTW